MVTLEIPDDDPLILFEFLSRIDDLDNEERTLELKLEDISELYSLFQLLGSLQRTLVEPFMANYLELVEEARTSVKKLWGDVD